MTPTGAYSPGLVQDFAVPPVGGARADPSAPMPARCNARCSRRLGVLAFLAASHARARRVPVGGCGRRAGPPDDRRPAGTRRLDDAPQRHDPLARQHRGRDALHPRRPAGADLPEPVRGDPPRDRAPHAADRRGHVAVDRRPHARLAHHLARRRADAPSAAATGSAALTGPTTARLTAALSPSSDAATAYFEFGPDAHVRTRDAGARDRLAREGPRRSATRSPTSSRVPPTTTGSS